jgi:predicted DNA-binding transcriptional regulator AlpA
MESTPNALLETLLSRVGTRVVIRPEQSFECFGWSKSTSHKMIARGELPALRNFGGRTSGWLVHEVIEKLARAPASSLVGPRSPGRPRKPKTDEVA